MQSRHLLSVLAVAIVLAGCDASTSEPANSAGGGGSPGPGPVAAATLNGQVVKGITRHALVSAYVPDGHGGFVQAGTPQLSNADGSFSMPLGNYTGVIKIVATRSNDPAFPTMMHCDAAAGCGPYPAANAEDANGNGNIDFGEWGPVAANFELRGVASMVGGGIHFISLTPLSTLAADWAQQFPGGLSPETANSANTQVAVTFGLSGADEMHSPCGDIANDQWRNLASEQQLKLPLMIAAFQEAAQYVSFDAQQIIDMFSDAFVENQGRLPQDVEGLEASIGGLFRVERALVGTIDLPPVRQSAIDASLASAMSQLQSGKLTPLVAVNGEHFLDALGFLGDDIQKVLEITGLDDPEQFVEDQKPNYDWLGDPANTGILGVAVHTVLYSVVASFDLSRALTAGQDEIVYTSEPLTKLDIPGKKLVIQGNVSGQDVDITVNLTSMRDGILNHRFVFGINATLSNAVAHGGMQGTMDIGTGTTDLQALWDAMNDSPTVGIGGYSALSLELANLLRTANGTLALSGSASLVNNADDAKALMGRVALTGAVNLGAAAGQQIAALDVTEGDLTLPDGSHFYQLPSEPVLHVFVGDNATLTLDGGGTVLGLPAAIAHAEGTMTHSRELFLHLRELVIRNLDFFLQVLLQSASADAIQAFSDELLDFDYGQVVLNGSGQIDIPTLPSASGLGGQQYRGTLTGPLNDMTVTLFQPHSDVVALVMNLDPAESRVRMTIGTEPWELRAMTTPTPRLVMLGPKGQYSEVSQEEVYSFIEGVPFSDVILNWRPKRH